MAESRHTGPIRLTGTVEFCKEAPDRSRQFNAPRVVTGGGKPSQPSNFDEAVIEMLHRGHGPRESIEAAAKEWPHLWKAYQAMLKITE